MKSIILLISFVFLGLFLRLYHLADRPIGFTWDEAALGYNAFSLLHTGRDEFGLTAPVVFKSFGDYKPGLYIYTAVPSVAILGLNEFATRFPSAIAGTLLILVIFVLVRTLFPAKNYALFTALTLAISPLAMHFSRGAWEANLSLLLTTLGAALFIRRRFSISALMFGLTLLTYQGAKLFTPLIILVLFFTFRPQVSFRKLILPIIILLMCLFPILVNFNSQSGRLKVFSVFSYTRQLQTIKDIMRQDNTTHPNLIYYLFHSEKLDQFRGISARYLNYFSPRFLFTTGNWSDARQATAPFYGNLHYPEILTLLIGLAILFKSRTRQSALILSWLILAPLPAAFSRDIISSVRALPIIVPLSIVIGIGLAKLISHSKIVFIYFVIAGFFLFYFLDLYFIHSPQYTAIDWLSPYKPVMQLVGQQMSNYTNIVFTDKLGQPYIFVLFYLRINPHQLNGQLVRVDNPYGDVGRVESFGKFSFRPINWPGDRGASSTLFVGDQYELPAKDLAQTPGLIHFGSIPYPNGSPGLSVVSLP